MVPVVNAEGHVEVHLLTDAFVLDSAREHITKTVLQAMVTMVTGRTSIPVLKKAPPAGASLQICIILFMEFLLP